MKDLARNSPDSVASTLSSKSFNSRIKRLRRSGIIDIFLSWKASTAYFIVSPISILERVPNISCARLKKPFLSLRVYYSNELDMAGPQTTPLPKGRQYYTAREATPLSATSKGRTMGSRVKKRQSQTAAMARRPKMLASGLACSTYPKQKNLGDLAIRIFSDMHPANLIKILQFGRQGVAAKGCLESDPKAQPSSRRGNPCAFRTLLNDGASSLDSLSNSTYEDMESEDIRFDDSECISIGRTLGNVPDHQLKKRVDSGIVLEKQGRNLYSVPADLLAPENEHVDETLGNNSCIKGDIEMAICSSIFTTQDDSTDQSASANQAPVASNLPNLLDLDNQAISSMEAVNMPFFWCEPRLKRHQRFPFRDHDVTNDEDDDDMSIISDLSLIPSYSPGGVDQQYKVKVGRAVLKQILKSQAKAASKTVRQIKRSCREAMEHAFDHSSPAYKPTTCVRVGDAF
ncbi:hypothetical protein QBC41DRAFT_353064 [Cercophora samala]|uniref:Uncharacterized protein n=1 Tax=Cercophora samala TaxID=330535 RepID=A0AA39ZKP6_9PEZI|nr:hypothetical protein QBC41DRAFT_353064 [Cercophora samala]